MKRAETQDAYSYMQAGAEDRQPDNFLQMLIDAREYDVPYYVRCSIDLDFRSVVVRRWPPPSCARALDSYVFGPLRSREPQAKVIFFASKIIVVHEKYSRSDRFFTYMVKSLYLNRFGCKRVYPR